MCTCDCLHRAQNLYTETRRLSLLYSYDTLIKSRLFRRSNQENTDGLVYQKSRTINLAWLYLYHLKQQVRKFCLNYMMPVCMQAIWKQSLESQSCRNVAFFTMNSFWCAGQSARTQNHVEVQHYVMKKRRADSIVLQPHPNRSLRLSTDLILQVILTYTGVWASAADMLRVSGLVAPLNEPIRRLE